jgi:anti-anti-sigma factor
MASVERTTQGEVTILRVRGDLTVTEVGAVEPAFKSLAESPGARVVVDLSGVPQVTTPAISLFITTTVAARSTGGKVVFGRPTPLVSDVLHRCRLDRVLSIAATEDEAMEMARA